MGCDIHVWAERSEHGCWEVVGCMPEALETRDYGMFGVLAGIRNYSAVTPSPSVAGCQRTRVLECARPLGIATALIAPLG
jgi:hypothetical protein